MALRPKMARGQAGVRGRILRTALPTMMVAMVLALWSSPGHSSASQTTSSTTSSDTLHKVTSTLDGKHSIPLRTHWIAKPEPAGAIVTQVDFLIDGKLAWTEMNSPYVFGSDDDGANLGYLITTWLTPGRHTFTVRAIGESGRAVSDTVNAPRRGCAKAAGSSPGHVGPDLDPAGHHKCRPDAGSSHRRLATGL